MHYNEAVICLWGFGNRIATTWQWFASFKYNRKFLFRLFGRIISAVAQAGINRHYNFRLALPAGPEQKNQPVRIEWLIVGHA